MSISSKWNSLFRQTNIKNYQTSVSNYIIGCDKYQFNDKYYRYIKVDPTIYDISLLNNLFNGNAIMVKSILFFKYNI